MFFGFPPQRREAGIYAVPLLALVSLLTALTDVFLQGASPRYDLC